MAEYKVGLGVLRFKYADGRRVTAFRGDVVDVPDEVAEKHARDLYPVDHEFALPGSLIPLTDDASEEHISNYLASGSAQEIINQLDEATPALKGRLLVHERRGYNRERLVEALEGASDTKAVREAVAAAELAAEDNERALAEQEALGEVPVEPQGDPVPTETPAADVHVAAPADLTDANSDEEVTAYLGVANVDEVKEASVDWSAELRTRAATAEQGGKARKGVLEALGTPQE